MGGEVKVQPRAGWQHLTLVQGRAVRNRRSQARGLERESTTTERHVTVGTTLSTQLPLHLVCVRLLETLDWK